MKIGLKKKKRKDNYYSFEVIDIEEIKNRDDKIMNYLGEIILDCYRNKISFAKRHSGKDEQEIIDYLNDYVFPSDDNQITQNVKQGDFGEILMMDIIKKFRKLEVPIYKMRWKFNNNRSVFSTDVFAHNKGEEINTLKYYEIKTRRTYSKKVGKKAHESLKSDIPNEQIADFLDRYYFEKAELFFNEGLEEKANKYYKIANKYRNIVENPSEYERSFELTLIIEKNKFKEKIIEELDTLSSKLAPLKVTVILVNDLKELVNSSYDEAYKSAIEIACGDNYE